MLPDEVEEDLPDVEDLLDEEDVSEDLPVDDEVVPEVLPLDTAPDLAADPALVLKVPLDTLVLGFTLLPATCLFWNEPSE